ncbi:hypothetical protein M758_1G246600 [Ceratodon purpureus]|uniref:Glycosyltransferase n=1 Tax=Ceratodon purpureus TaxID=3225 RepID=A0A8T0J962_CERPU|nr:hypothetical protein KC19_1G252900 [Ceratodon purpureus]KAG0631354.1 hypothetical protein M758_1G246600 [Ceratodon purpureus]
MKIEHRNEKVAKDLHAVIIPYPAQGHMTPSFQLAKKLVGLGFRITFVNTEHNHDRIMKSRSKANMEPDKNIKFVPVSDGLPEDHPRLRDLTAFCDATLKMGPAFEELFLSLMLESPITCVIRDIRFSGVHAVAKKLGLPIVAFVTPSAISTHCCYHLQTFISAGLLPLPPPPAHAAPSLDHKYYTLGPPQSDEEAAARQAPLTGLPGGSPTMRVGDLPTFVLSHDPSTFFFRLHQEIQNPLVPDCDCILYNTFHDLEGEILDAMSSMNSNIFAIGPLVLNPTTVDEVEELTMAGAGSAMWEEDSVSLSWLDAQSPDSVLFVSFGSLATITSEEIQEFAWGLELSGHAFLWAIRPELLESMCEKKEFGSMFSQFLTRTSDRGLLVPWAPQTAVLLHPSVTAFLTHCGWNSTIESISSGLPMLGWPRFADQNTNCHYITQVWKIGLELKSQVKDGREVVSKEEVAQKVKRIMARGETDLEVEVIRTNCRNLRMKARKAMLKGGSSQIALAKFVELIERRATHSAPPS